MARERRPRALGVWFDGILAAELTARQPWEIYCRYTPDAAERWPGNAPVLSCSLPLSTRRQPASVFCDGLLPEAQTRQGLAERRNLPVTYTFDLLAAYGRDVAGALVISAEEPEPRRWSVEPYTADTLAEEVAGLPENPLAIHEDSELSLAGIQDKLLLVKMDDGGWGRPVHGHPTTHILKRDHPRFPGLIEAEADALRLARAVGLTTIDPVVEQIAGGPCLIVDRFDRERAQDGSIRRIHQEDLCQALGRDPRTQAGRGKYQDAGGPSLREAAELLGRYAADSGAQLAKLLQVVAFTVVVGNADAHGKNLALLHYAPEWVSLAPLYDTVPTVLWPDLRSRAAMSVNHMVNIEIISPDDLVAEARSWGYRAGIEVITDIIEQLGHLAASGAIIDPDGPTGRLVVARAKAMLNSPPH
ncbi:MAG TPA: HipA domain-containing protein [Acidimicrobiales bacterium]|nr:HipA domain-containing protein [Acidimicrobiales bacterium]